MTRRLLDRMAIAILLLAGWAARSSAQTNGDLHPGDRSVGAWVGFSPDSPAGSYLGVTPGRQLFLVGARAEWVLESTGAIVLAATADLLPVAVVTHNPTYRTVRRVSSSTGAVFESKVVTGESPVFGAGLSPFGLKLYLTHAKGIRLYGGGAAGALWFTRNTPVPDARRFNVTFETGAGVELARSRSQAFVLGYKFHHLSNAYSAPENPGLDGNVIYFGVLRRR